MRSRIANRFLLAWLWVGLPGAGVLAQFPRTLPPMGMEEGPEEAIQACRASLGRLMTALSEHEVEVLRLYQFAEARPGQAALECVVPRRLFEAAARRTIGVLNQADAETLRLYIYAHMRVAAQQQARDAIVECILARRLLESAARERFGDAGVAAVGGPVRIIEGDAQALRSARFEPRSEREMIGTLASGMAPLQMRRSQEGRWRLVIRAITSFYDSGTDRIPEPGSLVRIEGIRGIARATRFTSEQLLAGKIDTPERLKAVLDKAVVQSTLEP